MVAALLRNFRALYKVSVYQVKFDGGQAPFPVARYKIGCSGEILQTG